MPREGELTIKVNAHVREARREIRLLARSFVGLSRELETLLGLEHTLSDQMRNWLNIASHTVNLVYTLSRARQWASQMNILEGLTSAFRNAAEASWNPGWSAAIVATTFGAAAALGITVSLGMSHGGSVTSFGSNAPDLQQLSGLR